MKVSGVDFSRRFEPQAEAEWREHMFDELAEHTPRMRSQATRAEFWQWFSGEADSVTRNLPKAQSKPLCVRINALLLEAGSSSHYFPSDDR